ncbi:fatty acid synthase-like [Cylas formicarius]|uniref:fatty acid synthase-like n=1 Tax=Cylas formicarius TaxID=197179 RepID=UPI0029584BB7|nr:fatty acid synthase-like [Cylas formicarius]
MNPEMELVKEDVVISGIGGYFPQSLNIEELMNNLLENKDLVTTRWRQGERGVTNRVGVVPTEYFDHSFFGIHRQQCTYMDPMQRLALERTFEALIDAGVNPTEVKGRRIGVYMASAIGENDNLFLESIVSGFGVTGHSRAMMPNRISYWLNLKGPSVAYDSNWIGGMEVIRLAYEAIKTGQCESVIVGTANLALNAEFQWLYNDMGLLSPDGCTRAFDANANGYARSDGIVVLYIQKASEARRAYASVVNVATRFDGNREGTLLDISVPNMVEFMNEFYDRSSVKPEEVEFIETYGCANKITDEKELDALAQVYCRNRNEPVLIGSVKTNAGHSEASAVMFSVAKVLVAMETGQIPANINFEKPNPNIKALVDGKLKVVTQNTEWKPTYAAVNALGLDSYYGHLLLKANSKTKTQKMDDLPRLITASTRTEDGIKSIIEKVKTKTDDPEYFHMVQDLFAKPIMGHLYRGYTIVGVPEPKEEFEYHQGTKRQVWFVYSGMGSQWCGMVSDLMKLPVFAEAIRKCHEILKPKGIDLMHIITTSDKTIFDNILHSFVGIAAIQIGLTDLLKAVGIVPDGIIGHSVGELGCAYGDGCLTAEQMILSAYSRGKASIEVKLIPGMMAAVGMGYQAIKNKIPSTIEVACHNGPDSATLSGPKADMEKYVAELQAQGVFARLVNVANIAYHSQYIRPAAPKLLEYMKEIIPTPTLRSSKWVSTSNTEDTWNGDLAKNSSAEYHTNNLLSAVYFEEGLKHIPKDSILIEIAPHGLLQAILKRSLKSGCTNIPLTQRGSKSGLEFLLGAMGKMYLSGLDLNVSNIYPKIEYPVGRGTPSLAPFSHWNHSELWRTGLEDKLHSLLSVIDLQVTLNSEEFRECVGHQLDDTILLPSSFYLNIAYQLISNISSGHKEIVFENLYFRKPLRIPKIGSVPLHAMVQKGSGEFEITSNKEILMTGRMTFPQATDQFMIDPYTVDVADDNVRLSGTDIYNELQHRGHKYSGQFKAIKSLVIAEEGSKATVHWNKRWSMLIEAMIQQQLVLTGERNQDIQIPKTIQKIAIDLKSLPEDKCDLEVDFDYATNVVSTDGLQLIGLQMVPHDKEEKAVYIDSFEYVPLMGNVYTKMETGICVALQLMLNNFHDQYITNIMITEIQSDNLLQQGIQSALSQYTKLNPNVSIAKDVKQVAIQHSYPLLLVFNDQLTEDIAKVVATTHAFLLVQTGKTILSYPELVTVSEFSYEDVSYSILRKANITEVSVVSVKGDALSIKDLKRSTVSWVNELYASVEAASSQHKRVYLVSSVIPTEGFTNFVEELRSQQNMECVRVLINLDKAKPVDVKQLHKQDLILSVIKDGKDNAYLAIPIKFKDHLAMNNATNNIMKNKFVTHLGINLRDETLNPEFEKPNELGVLDYSGTSSSGQRVMGLAHLDRDTCSIIPDSIFTFDVPENWTLEDGATIPYAYLSAFYALFTKGRLKPGETVLVHAGCSPIGLAAISIASINGCSVYATVSTDYQRAYLKKQFPNLKDRNILSSDNSSFEPLLMTATGGKGADIIVNCLSGSLLQSSLACIADFGRFIHYGKHDIEENNSIGMYCFLRNTSFYAVDFCDVINQSSEIKEDLKQMLREGIEKLSVRPLFRRVVDHQDVGAILRTIKQGGNLGKAVINIDNTLSMSKLNVKKPTQFICDPKSSYLIYGGSSEQWADITEWIVLRGAKKIVICSESKPQQNHLNRRLSLLQTYFGVDIIFASSRTHAREGATELLSEVDFLGPIHAVFLLPPKNNSSRVSDTKPVQYIDYALRTAAPKAIYVNFINSAAGICQLRADAGYTSYNVQWLKEYEFGDVLASLDDILTLRVTNVLVINDKSGDTRQESAQALVKKLSQMLPASPEVVAERSEEAPKEPEMIQIVTEGPREMRELAPLFIIPGLNTEKEVEELGRHLLLPTFVAVLPSTATPVKKLAETYAKQILEIWPKGPYNLVGISWGGVLTIEIAKILDKLNASIHIYFIDGAPTTIQSAIRRLGDQPKDMEINLLTRIFNNTEAQVVKKLQSLNDWEARVKFLIDIYSGDSIERSSLENGLNVLKNRLRDVLDYQPAEDLVSGTIHLVRPNDCSEYDNCDLTLYCKQTPQVFLVHGDHVTIIDHRDTAEYINETFQLI